MFELEAHIEKWRAEIARTGIVREVADELEGHLREDLMKHEHTGLDGPQAFEAAVKRIGPAALLQSEFKKLGLRSWDRRLALVAWMMYVVSFFLPGYGTGRGWACALMQHYMWDGAIHGNWPAINYELLTLVNLLMLASPFLLFRFGGRRRGLKWFRKLNLIAMLLVWAFIGLLLTSTGDRAAMKIGCYVWGLSFVVLQVCTVRWPSFRNNVLPATAG